MPTPKKLFEGTDIIEDGKQVDIKNNELYANESFDLDKYITMLKKLVKLKFPAHAEAFALPMPKLLYKLCAFIKIYNA